MNFQLAAAIPLGAQSFWDEMVNVPFLEWLTNSIVVSVIVVATIIFLARRATRRMQLVPTGTQNVFEAVISMLYTMLEGIVGKHMIAKTFSLLATLFIYILISNWFGLMPGVGSIGWGERIGPLSLESAEVPLLRPGTADLNTTLGMAAVFMVMWLYWSISELGVGGSLKHIFGTKGGLTGVMALALAPVFFVVGLIEVVSIGFRPVSLSLRLFGNVFAGENLLSTMITLGETLGLPTFLAYISSIIIPIPFYFLELLIGLLQALVFTLLCAVYIQLSTTHEEGDAHH
ncbi:MAG: F0F1 ATP synthase subunit A [Chthoniobacterales bacterium]